MTIVPVYNITRADSRGGARGFYWGQLTPIKFEKYYTNILLASVFR
jgi:hypothetical protein